MKRPGRVHAFTLPRIPERELRDAARATPAALVRPIRRTLCGLVLALTVTFSASMLRATELAPGLTYLRPGVELSPEIGSAVLDLRAPMDDAALVSLLAAIAPGSTNPQRVLLILMSPDTPVGVRKHIALLPRCITVGRTDPGLKTDITVSATAEADQRAIEALVAGTAPEKLLVENADKRRYDESSLIREHQGVLSTEDASDPSASEGTKPAADATPSEPPLVDAVLQRALHVYRGLVVLKRL